MDFCPRCKKLLIPIRGEDYVYTECPDCGIKTRVYSEQVNEKISPEEIGEGVITDENLFATYEYKCKKCGYDKAEVIDMGIFISDEDNLILMRCGKCGHTDRIGRKTS